MTAIERVSLLDSNDSLLNSDYDFSAFELRLTDNTWGVLFDDVDVKTEFDLSWTSGDVTISAWNAIIVATRATSTPIANKKIAVRYQLSDTKTLTGTGTKIYIELDQTLIDDPTLIEDTYPSTDYAQGKNIWTMRRTADRPTTNPYIKLWEYTGWVWVDNRDYPKLNGDKIDLDYVVKLTWNQTISDIKTFLLSPIVPTPTTDYQASTKKYVDDNLASIWDQHKLTNSDFMTGEALVEWDSLFAETWPTFAEATLAQNIGDVAGNTRVSFPVIWSGIDSNNIKLALAKNWSPTAFLRVRLETDNAGSPSGTLIDPNATKDIDPATLTTSLADTTVTFPWSFTVANGTKVHTVVSAVWDVVNASNYYKIGFNNLSTTTRNALLYNSSIRAPYAPSWPVQHTITDTVTQTDSGGTSFGTRTLNIWITPKYNIILKTQTAGWSLSWGGYSWITSSTPNIVLQAWITYTATSTTEGYSANSPTATSSNVVFTNYSWGNQNQWYSITTEVYLIFPYISSTLFHNTVYSKTDARYTYKLPDIPRIVDKSYSAGEIPKRDFKGITKHLTGLTKGTELFVSDTPGALSTISGTEIYKIWDVIDTDEIDLWGSNSSLITIKTAGLSANYSFTSDIKQAPYDWIIIMTTAATWASSGSSCTLYIWATSNPTTIIAEATDWRYVHWHIKKWRYWKFVETANVNTTWWSYKVAFMQDK